MPHAFHVPAFAPLPPPEPASDPPELVPNLPDPQTTHSSPFTPAATMPKQSQHPKLDLGRWQSQVFEVIKKQIRPVQSHKSQYINESGLKTIGIDWNDQSIIFSAGHIPNPSYFAPIHPDTIRGLLGRTRGLEERDDFIYHPKGPNAATFERHETTGQWLAQDLWDLIHIHLTHCDESASRDQLSIRNTVRWEYSDLQARTLSRLSQGIHDWQVKKYLRFYTTTSSDDLDPDVPHCIAFVGDSAPLQRGMLLTSEVLTLMWLTVTCAAEKDFNKHKAYPMILVAASGLQVRVHQACFYPNKKHFSVQSSHIIDFPNGVRDKMDDYMKLLGWVIAKPMGSTRG